MFHQKILGEFGTPPQITKPSVWIGQGKFNDFTHLANLLGKTSNIALVVICLKSALEKVPTKIFSQTDPSQKKSPFNKQIQLKIGNLVS